MQISDQFDLTRLLRRDVQPLVEILNDPVYAQMTSHIPYPYQTDDAQKWIAMHTQDHEDDPAQVWAIRDRHSQKISGVIGLHDYEVSKKQIEVGYWVARDLWGQGMATSTLSVLMAHIQSTLSDKVNQVIAHTFLNNRASERVLEKNNFRKQKTISNHIEKKGKVLKAHLWKKRLDV